MRSGPTVILGVPNDLPVVISGSLAVDLVNSIGFAAIGGHLNRERAAKMEGQLYEAIEKARK